MKPPAKIAAVVLAVLLTGYGIKEAVRKYPSVRADILEDIRRAEIYELSRVDAAIGFHAKMDTLMAFVHNNSIHNIDDEFWDDFKNKPRSLDKFLAHARGETDQKPHMECSTRSKLLMPLIHKAGFEAHMVDMFKYDDEYRSHVIVEVKNPETGKWEIYDPSYQIYWKNDKTGERSGVKEMVEAADFFFTPCVNAERCGYRRKDHDQPARADLPEFFGYAVVMNDEGQGHVAYNNPAIFDVTKPPKGQDKLFCDWGKNRWCPGRE